MAGEGGCIVKADAWKGATLLAVTASLAGATAWAQEKLPAGAGHVDSGDTAFILASAGLVFIMIGGVAFLEAGSLWIHFMLDRLEHRYKNSLAKILPQLAPKSARPPMDYIKGGNIYFSAEIEDALLPQVIELVGKEQIVFGSDMPHGDRERFAGRMLQEREDLSDSAKVSILEKNPLRFYGLSSG